MNNQTKTPWGWIIGIIIVLGLIAWWGYAQMNPTPTMPSGNVPTQDTYAPEPSQVPPTEATSTSATSTK